MANALVYIELSSGAVLRESLLALNHGRRIATRLGATLYAVVPTADVPHKRDDAIVNVLSRHGADKIVMVTNPQLGSPPLYATHGQALRTTCDQFPPQLVLLPATAGGHDIGARLALDLDGYFASYVDIDTPEENVSDTKHAAPITISRPIFRRSLNETQALTTVGRPLVLTLATSEADPHELGTDDAEIVVIQAPTDERSGLRIIATEETQRLPLAITGGAGLDAATFSSLRELADRLDAPLFASEAACAKGLADPAMQVGRDGHVIDADIYLVVGAAGSDQHLATLTPRTRVVAINTDAASPIAGIADAIFIGDAHATVEALLKLYDAAKKAPKDRKESPKPKPETTGEKNQATTPLSSERGDDDPSEGSEP